MYQISRSSSRSPAFILLTVKSSVLFFNYRGCAPAGSTQTSQQQSWARGCAAGPRVPEVPRPQLREELARSIFAQRSLPRPASIHNLVPGHLARRWGWVPAAPETWRRRGDAAAFVRLRPGIAALQEPRKTFAHRRVPAAAAEAARRALGGGGDAGSTPSESRPRQAARVLQLAGVGSCRKCSLWY